MNYPFWVFDWNRVKDYQDKYPLSKGSIVAGVCKAG